MNLNKKKGDRDLEQEKNKGDFFVRRTTFCSSGEKMTNASGYQCKVKLNERQ